MSRPSRLHALLMVRDEADIIDRSLDHLLSRFDTLLVFDTGSTDGTREAIERRAAAEPRLEVFAHPFEHGPVLFHAGLRALMFERFRDRFRPGDWVARVDADEFFITPPREFIASLRAHESVIVTQNHDLLFVRRDPPPEPGPDGEPSSLPIEWPPPTGARAYIDNPTYEPRFFRYRRSMRWAPDRWLPFNPGVAAARRLGVLHERWRSPEQAIRRWALRLATSPDMPIGGAHWARARTWYAAARKRSNPQLRWLAPGEVPPPTTDADHRPSRRKHLALRALHGSGLVRLLDRTRPGLAPEFAPEPFPAERLAEARRLEARALAQLARWLDRPEVVLPPDHRPAPAADSPTIASTPAPASPTGAEPGV